MKGTRRKPLSVVLCTFLFLLCRGLYEDIRSSRVAKGLLGVHCEFHIPNDSDVLHPGLKYIQEYTSKFEVSITKGRWRRNWEFYEDVQSYPIGGLLQAETGSSKQVQRILYDLLGMNNDRLEGFYSFYNGSRLLISSPTQSICSENLHVWKKLWPCKHYTSSIAGLLTSKRVFQHNELPTFYTSLSLKLEQGVFYMKLTLIAPESTFDSIPALELEACPLASISKLSTHRRVYNLIDKEQEEVPSPPITSQYSYVTQRAVGYHLDNSEIVLEIHIVNDTTTFELWYNIPSFMKVKDITCDMHVISQNMHIDPTSNSSNVQLHITLHNPENHLYIVRIPFIKQFLKSSEFPPDASRGLDVPGPIYSIDGNKYYANTIIIMLPFPDNSMIFNTIVMSSCLYAYTISNLFILLISSSQEIKERQESSLFTKIISKFITT